MHNVTINSLNRHVLLFNKVKSVEENPVSFNLLPLNMYFYKKVATFKWNSMSAHTQQWQYREFKQKFYFQAMTHGQFSAINAWLKSGNHGHPI